MKSHFWYCFLLLALVSCKPENPSTASEESTQVVAQSDFMEVEAAVLSSGKLFRIEKFESQFVSPRNVDVWIPENYSDSIAHATLYMHDGQMLFDSTTTWNQQEWKVDETITDLMHKGEIKPTLVVGMWNVEEDRHTDYFPQKPWENLSDSTRQAILEENYAQSESLFRKDINSDQYIRFITEEVMPLVEKNFSVSDEPKNRAVAGSSMGGLISWYTVLEKPYIFGTAICMSTHWPGAMPIEYNPLPHAFFDYISQKLPKPNQGHKFYFDFGTETLDALYPPFEDKVNAVFHAKNYTASSFKNLKFEGTDHSERSWNKRLHIPLKFAFGNKILID